MDTREMFGKLTNARGDGGRGGGCYLQRISIPIKGGVEWQCLEWFLVIDTKVTSSCVYGFGLSTGCSFSLSA